jgi:hypothetical protein
MDFCGSTATCETGSVGCETHPKKPEMVKSNRPVSEVVVFWVLTRWWITWAWQNTVLEVVLHLLYIQIDKRNHTNIYIYYVYL